MKAPTASPRSRRVARGATVVVLSLLLHAAIWLLSPKVLAPRPPKKQAPIQFEVLETPNQPSTAPPAKEADRPRVRRAERRAPREPVATPQPSAVPAPSQPIAQTPVPETPTPPSTEPPVKQAAPSGTASKADPAPAPKVDLFPKSALGMSVSRWRDTAPSAPSSPSFRSTQIDRGDGAPDSAEAENSRVNGRLGAMIADANGAGRVSGGLAGACDDGVDNNIDAEIDCMDPGCRQLPVCKYTGIYFDTPFLEIPDADGQKLTQELVVTQEGRIRKLAVMVRVKHGSPGDLSIILESPSGERAVLRTADRGDGHFSRSYYVWQFENLRAAGRWKLFVEDRIAGSVGSLDAWELYVTS